MISSGRSDQRDHSVVLDIDALSHRFGGVLAVDHVSVQVQVGEVLGVIGPNGAGKTTLLNAVSGVVRPTAGQVRFRGEEITGRPANWIAQRGLARTFQLAEGFNEFTVWDYLQLSRGCARDPQTGASITTAEYADRCLDWLAWIGADDAVDVNLRHLSYGVRKLIDLCRVVATEPIVMLLDEPTSGLARGDRARMRDRLIALREESRTLVIVDHDVSFVSDVSTRVIALEQGKKIADGEPVSVLNDPKVLVSYLGA